jgi:UPF0755 protein
MPSRFRSRRLLVGVLAAAAVLYAVLVVFVGTGRGPNRRVSVPTGATLRVAAESLEAAGMVSSPRAFRAYARLTGRERTLKPGTYDIGAGASWETILQMIVSGRGLVSTILIPEGSQLAEIESTLVRTLKLHPDSVRAASRDSGLRAQVGAPTPHLEGYLFPDTYFFPDVTTARQAVTIMVRRFEQKWDAAWSDRLDSLSMTRHQILTLASIIEEEARLAEERPIISAVYHNRLKAGMPLQADPTVQYARGQHTARVLHRDLEVDSPYNTYKNVGLPPGPIASPGRASIEAALYPASVPFRYFVAHPDGHHEFRVTFEEHQKAVAAMARLRRTGR